MAAGPTAKTTLNYTIDNPNDQPVTGLAFSDTLPVGLQVASPNNLSNSCGGVVNAVLGGNLISLVNGLLAATANCTISIDLQVTATAAGTLSPGLDSNGQPSA